MQKKLLSFLVFSNFIYANEYEFNLDDLNEVETKSYEYSGYLKAEHKYQILNESSAKYLMKNKDDMQSYFGQALLDFKYSFKLSSPLICTISQISPSF